MKILVVLIVAATVCGCVTADRFVSPTAEFKIGERNEIYIRTLKVTHVYEDYVFVEHEEYDSERLNIAVVPLVNDYVTHAYLRKGVYEYVGPYTYTTKMGYERTIRMFKEVSDADGGK